MGRYGLDGDGRKSNLNFNCLLVLLPDEIIDSVIVHELCHRKQMNHSAKFYAEIEKVFPDYNCCRQWLKQNGNKYMSRIPKQINGFRLFFICNTKLASKANVNTNTKIHLQFISLVGEIFSPNP